MTFATCTILALSASNLVFFLLWRHCKLEAEGFKDSLATAKGALAAGNEARLADATAHKAELGRLERALADKNVAVLECRDDFAKAVASLPGDQAVAVVAPYFDRVLSAGGGAVHRPPSPDDVLTDPATRPKARP